MNEYEGTAIALAQNLK